MPIDAALLIPDRNLSNSVAELRARIIGNLEEAQKIISSNTQLAQQRMKEQYDKTAAPVQYDVGSKVWVFTPKKPKGLSKKLSHNFHGPNRIVSKLSPVHFKLHTMENRPVSVPVHANRLKPYFDPNDRPIAAPTIDLSTPDLSDTDLPADSFPADANSADKDDPTPDAYPAHSDAHSPTDPEESEPSITRPEDLHSPDRIVDIFPSSQET